MGTKDYKFISQSVWPDVDIINSPIFLKKVAEAISFKKDIFQKNPKSCQTFVRKCVVPRPFKITQTGHTDHHDKSSGSVVNACFLQ